MLSNVFNTLEPHCWKTHAETIVSDNINIIKSAVSMNFKPATTYSDNNNLIYKDNLI